MNLKTILAAAITTTFLAACGGGGGTPVAGGLSVTQTNFETAAIKDTYVNFDWNLPTTNVAPTNGTHFFYAQNYSASASPSTGPQLVTAPISNMAKTLALPTQPTLSTRYVDRVLKSGVIYAANLTTKGVYSYAGNDVISTSYATDGLTTLFSSVYDDWSAPIPLSGQIGNTTILKSFYWFAKQTAQTVNFDFTQNWLAGSTYFTRKGYRQADTLFVYDWTGSTYDANVTAYTGVETTIENYFNSAPVLAAGGLNWDGIVYAISDGAISSMQGTRAWIATNKRPTSARSTDEYAVLFQLNGKIYAGGLQKAGTRFKSIDGINNTIVNDYSIRLNSTAGASMKQVVKF